MSEEIYLKVLYFFESLESYPVAKYYLEGLEKQTQLSLEIQIKVWKSMSSISTSSHLLL